MITGNDIVTAARQWLGVRWRHQGRNKHGLDCIGLVVAACRAAGLRVADYEGYGPDGDPVNFLALFAAAGAVRLPSSLVQPGDILAFRQAGFPCHCGIASQLDGQPAVIHASRPRGGVVEELLTRTRPVSAFSIPGVTTQWHS